MLIEKWAPKRARLAGPVVQIRMVAGLVGWGHTIPNVFRFLYPCGRAMPDGVGICLLVTIHKAGGLKR